MHSQAHSLNSLFRTISLAMIAVCVMAVAMFPAWAQNSVPPTAVQAAKMPQYASRLAHPSKRVLPPKSQVFAQATKHRGPLDSSDLYDNGPINGNTDAWTINFGYSTSDSFNVSNDGTALTGMSFGAWLFPGDTQVSVEVSITSGENGGASYFDQTVNFTESNCTGNQFGFNVCTETGTFNGPTMNAGTYWVNLQNASVPSGDPVYWDENSGVGCTGQGCPSSASETTIGSIPSESFTILGNATTTTSSTACSIGSQHELRVLRDLGQLAPSDYVSGVSVDRAGHVYGTLSAAGNYAQGLLYELSQRAGNWFVSSLYSFLGGSSGSSPFGVMVGPQGALYGSAEGGSGYGLIYEVTPPATACTTALCSPDETTIYQFTGNTDAAGGTVTTFDSAGNLYGIGGGGAYGNGAVFELSPLQGSWTEKLLYSFTGGSDGGGPNSLQFGRDGNLYGTASGGINNCPYQGGPCGVVFQLVPSAGGWTENVLYTFTGGVDDGGGPGGLIQDSQGNLYGFSECFTQFGGCYVAYADGLIFEISPPGGVGFLHIHSSDWGFCSYNGSWSWFTALAVDPEGNLYAAADGLAYWYPPGYYAYCGAVGTTKYPQQLISSNEEVFYNLTMDAMGNLYGTTAYCGPGNDGMVWEYSP